MMISECLRVGILGDVGQLRFPILVEVVKEQRDEIEQPHVAQYCTRRRRVFCLPLVGELATLHWLLRIQVCYLQFDFFHYH